MVNGSTPASAALWLYCIGYSGVCYILLTVLYAFCKGLGMYSVSGMCRGLWMQFESCLFVGSLLWILASLGVFFKFSSKGKSVEVSIVTNMNFIPVWVASPWGFSSVIDLSCGCPQYHHRFCTAAANWSIHCGFLVFTWAFSLLVHSSGWGELSQG